MEASDKWKQWALGLEAMTVLFVDDEENVLNSVKRILRREPYQVITQSSASQGLELIKSQPIQMIVSDQRMPEMNGIEFLEKARQLSPDSIRIMLTGYSDLKTAEQAINRVEIYRFLAKPWNDEDLKATIRQGLLNWQLKSANQTMLEVIDQQNQELQEFNQELERKVEERTQQLKEIQAHLIQSEKIATVGLLAGGIAHEINNPLGAILALTQLLLMDIKDNPALADDLHKIEEAVLQCKKITTSLLNFSRKPDSQKLELIHFPTVVENSLGLIGYIFRNARIEIVQDYDPDLPLLQGNPGLMLQVMINLLTNAQQAMKNGGRITISGKKNGDDGLVVEVQDEGEGIPDAIQSKIFDPFFTTKEPGKGTGLGLFIANGIVREHGGRMEFKSEAGKGTVMRLIFDGPNLN